MKQYEMLLAEIERRKKVLTVLGEGCIVGQRNATEYNLLCELEEFAKGLTSEVTSEATSEISEDMWEVSKQYALRQVLASTDVKMSEQAYLDLRLFSGFELAVAHKDGANWQKEQLMKVAIDGFVEEPVMFQWRIVSNDLDGEFVVNNKLTDGDKVKMIIIKEDKL